MVFILLITTDLNYRLFIVSQLDRSYDPGHNNTCHIWNKLLYNVAVAATTDKFKTKLLIN